MSVEQKIYDCYDSNPPQINLPIQYSFRQRTARFVEIEELILKFLWKLKEPRIVHAKKKSWKRTIWDSLFPILKLQANNTKQYRIAMNIGI